MKRYHSLDIIKLLHFSGMQIVKAIQVEYYDYLDKTASTK